MNSWNAIHFVTFCFLLLAKPLLSQDSSSEDIAKPSLKKPISISLNCAIKSLNLSSGETFFSMLELGELEPDSTYLLDLKMTNETSGPIAFDGVRPSCRCGRFAMKRGVIPIDETFPVNIEFDTPSYSENGSFSFAATILHERKEVGRFSFRGSLKNNLYVNPQIVFSVGTEIQSFVVPIVMSDPVKLESLEVSCAESLGDIQASIAKRDGKGLIEIVAMGTSFDGQFATGDLTIRDKRTGRKVTSNVLVTRRLPVSVSPTILRFRRDSDGNMSAKCVLQVDKSILVKKTQPNIRFSFAIRETKVLSDSKALVPGIYKVMLSITKEEWDELTNADEVEKVECTAFVDGSIHRQFVHVLGE